MKDVDFVMCLFTEIVGDKVLLFLVSSFGKYSRRRIAKGQARHIVTK